jgi:RimJ/RimL family protein N-acetyltransferase
MAFLIRNATWKNSVNRPWRLRREHWGQGYATEGVLALVASAFASMEFDRIQAQTMTINLGSRRVLEKAGFRHIETRLPPAPTATPGDEQGEVVYEIRRQRQHQHP